MSAPDIHLRALEPEDLQLLYEIENDPELRATSTLGAPCSRYALKQYIAQAGSIHETGQLRLIIEIQEPSSPPTAAGTIDLTNYSPVDARAEVGITILKPFRGQGIALAALSALEAYTTLHLRVHSLYAIVSQANQPSHNLFVRAGFAPVATLPHWLYRSRGYQDATLLQKIF